MVRSLPNLDVVTKGNHDEQASVNSDLVGFNPQAAMAIEWTRQQLRPGQQEWLASLPLRQTVGAKITVVHATLDMPHMWGYIFDKLTAAACMNYQFTQLCFFGHTHVPLGFDKFGDIEGGKYEKVDLQPGHKYLINVGSVGQPRDGDPRAAFVICSPEERVATLHRVEYDVKSCQQRILRAGLPERLAQRLAFGR
jgi:diadenosine tetraphosphatase ApaH/serine/threonine PP2A family protein phosphatase